MHPNTSSRRLAALVLVLVLVTTATLSGCSWFRKESKLYAQDAQSRPLEVPPDLDLPRTDAAVSVPGTPAVASATAPAAGVSSGFTVSGSREQTFEKVGEALAAIEGLTIASRAQLLGAYDVNYGGSNFLVRVSATDAGAYVSAVDPRGLPATGEAPAKVIAALKAALGGN